MKRPAILAAVAMVCAIGAQAQTKPFALVAPPPGVVLAPGEFELVRIAAKMFAEDVGRVTGSELLVSDKVPVKGNIVLAGTLGSSPAIDKLVAEGRLPEAEKIKGQWEATLTQIVEKPFPGVERALVIAGSDRRGTAYGLMRLSEKIGVSPWVWWADAPVLRRAEAQIACAVPEVDSPAVKYRGIFINDEDWGLYPWAKTYFDPQHGNIGPKTYEKVFQLLLRLRLNYLWPAMHACSTEFAAIPENARLADRYGIVAGASHCEPMLCNNVKWDTKTRGPWDYSTNRATIVSYWEESAKTRGGTEAVWTLGLRGIHDQGMKGPKDMSGRIALLEKVFADQLTLLDKYATNSYGRPAICFVPYKEVLPIYDAGLKVPADATLVWVDDNFGYIRRLSSPEERKRPGGAGVYWHLSYYGPPHSYTWINTTPPAFIWEELGKAWDNGARTLWVINVGDIKPAEIGMDFFSRFAWAPDSFGANSQPAFLREFAARNIGAKQAPAIADLMARFYRVGSTRKPELMERSWALLLSDREAARLTKEYSGLLSDEKKLFAEIPPAARDAYEELVGFPVKILAATGLIFMADRNMVRGIDKEANEKEISRLRKFIDEQVGHYNTGIAGGKWKGMMPGAETEERRLRRWNSQVRWPWGDEKATVPPASANVAWRDAASADRRSAAGQDGARWENVEGLGSSGRAVVLRRAGEAGTTLPQESACAPSLEYDFRSNGGDAEALLSFLPTFRLRPGMQLRVAVGVDGSAPQTYEVPGSSGKEDETGSVRATAVQNNSVVLRVPMPGLQPGTHTLRVQAMDPGAVLDRVGLP